MSILNQETGVSHTSGFEWSVVFAGTVIACAISIVMMSFGSVIGLSADAPLRGEANLAAWSVIISGIWILWVQLLASLAGGYTAGYLRRPSASFTAHENELHDGLYGFTVWATSTVLVFVGVSVAVMMAGFLVAQPEVDPEIANTVMTDTEQNTAIIFAFVTGATALLSGVAAWWAATMGGEHRALGTDFSHYVSFKAKQK